MIGYGVKPEQNGANLFSNHMKQPIDCSITERSADASVIATPLIILPYYVTGVFSFVQAFYCS